jgi:hypothetical protein
MKKMKPALSVEPFWKMKTNKQLTQLSSPLTPENLFKLHCLVTCETIYCAGILEQSMGARNRVGKGLPYRPARLHRLEESIPWNRFLGSLKV